MAKPKRNPVGPAPEINRGPDGSYTEKFDVIRNATRVEALATGEILYSHIPKNQQVPYFDLEQQAVQIVQISIPMRMNVVWANEDKRFKLYTEIMLSVPETNSCVILRNDTGGANIQDLNNFAPWTIEDALVRKIKVSQYGGAGLYDSDIQYENICVGDIAAWFGTQGSLRSQLHLWDEPIFSTGAQFSGRFPDSPWGIWFASDELSNNRIHAPIFCSSSMECFLKSRYGKTAKYDYSEIPNEVEDMFNPESKPTKVFSNSMTPGRNYKFVDRIMIREDKKKKYTTDMDKEAKSLVKSVLATNVGDSYTVL